MAVTWSPMDNSGNNGMKVGLDYSTTSVSNSSSSVRFDFDAWTGNRFNYDDNGQTIVWSGAISATDTYNNTQGSGTETKRAERSYTYNYPSGSYGSSPGKITQTVRVGYSYNGSHPTHTRTITIPARPIAAPNSPNNVSTSRLSDSQARVSWSRTHSAARPWTTIRIQRALDASGPWSTVATVSGSNTSWTDSSITSNRYYRYRVRAENSAGNSGYTASDGIRTSPAAPSNVVATKSGSNIVVTYTINKSYASGVQQVQRSVNGGTWTTVGSPNDTGTWTDTSPGVGDNRYRIREDVNSQGQQLYSGWAYSSTVSTILPPLPPTSVAGTWVSDTSVRTNWSRQVSTERPVSSQQIQRQTNGGDWGSTTTLAATTTSYTSTNTAPNSYYRFRVRAVNAAGASAWVETNVVRTTPAAPTNVRAAVQSGGASIRVTWSQNIPYSTFTWRIERSVNGGAWTQVATGLSAGVLNWTDNSPGAGSNQYRVRAVETSNTLLSGWGTSNVVSTIAPPLAPTHLSPNGVDLDADMPITIVWQHNPGGDEAEQTAFQWDMSVDNSPWSEGPKIDSPVSEHTFAGGEIPNGAEVRWRVRTWGVHPDPGPKAAVATFATSSTPQVVIDQPTHDEPVTVMPLEVAWTFSQMENLDQFAWQFQLQDPAGTVLDTANGTTETSYTLPRILPNGDYFVRVRARANTLWSEWDATPFTVDLLPPAEVIVSPALDEGTGWMVVNLTIEDPVDGVSSRVDSVSVQRRIDGGEWVTITPEPILIGEDSEQSLSVLDTTPILLGVNEYRVVATSVSPSSGTTEPVAYVTSGGCWSFLSWGDGYGQIVRANLDPSVETHTAVDTATQPAAGRKFPILLIGAQQTETVSINVGTCWGTAYGQPGSTGAEWKTAGHAKARVCWRDHLGNRVFGRVASGITVAADQTHHDTADITLVVERTDMEAV